MNSQNIKNGILILLILTAVVLGYFIYQQVSRTPAITPSIVQELPNEEAEVFATWPAEDAPAEEHIKHSELLASLAEDAEYLEIKDCKPTPFVLKIETGKAIEIRNLDAVSHTLLHGDGRLNIAANSTTSLVPSDFAKIAQGGGGNVGYRCDEQRRVGVFYIRAPQ